MKVAQKIKADSLGIAFAVSDVDDFRQELTEFGVDSPSSDAKYIIGRGAAGEKYKHEGEYS